MKVTAAEGAGESYLHVKFKGGAKKLWLIVLVLLTGQRREQISPRAPLSVEAASPDGVPASFRYSRAY